ncbi:MAG: PIG-L deacetylase family protein [Alphaproteobacteria bacterium]
MPAMKEDWLSAFDKIVVVSPHSDDAAFSCGGLLAETCGRGIESVILNCFAVSNYLPGTGETNPDKVTEARIAEDMAYGRLLGENCSASWLKNADALLRKGLHVSPFGEDMISDDDRAISTSLTHALDRFAGPGSAVFVPAGLGLHIDHLLVRDAGLAAAKTSSGTFFLYEDMPYAARHSRIEIAGIIHMLTSGNGLDAKPYDIGGDGLLNIKQQAAACYPSQLTEQTLTDILNCAREIGGERFWKLLTDES